MEGIDHGLYEGTIPAIVWSDFGKAAEIRMVADRESNRGLPECEPSAQLKDDQIHICASFETPSSTDTNSTSRTVQIGQQTLRRVINEESLQTQKSSVAVLAKVVVVTRRGGRNGEARLGPNSTGFDDLSAADGNGGAEIRAGLAPFSRLRHRHNWSTGSLQQESMGTTTGPAVGLNNGVSYVLRAAARTPRTAGLLLARTTYGSTQLALLWLTAGNRTFGTPFLLWHTDGMLMETELRVGGLLMALIWLINYIPALAAHNLYMLLVKAWVAICRLFDGCEEGQRHRCPYWLGRSPPITAIRVRSPAGSLPDLHMWESMLLAGGFSLGTSVSSALAFQHRSSLGSHFMSCPGITGTYRSQLESLSLGESCLALGSLPTRAHCVRSNGQCLQGRTWLRTCQTEMWWNEETCTSTAREKSTPQQFEKGSCGGAWWRQAVCRERVLNSDDNPGRLTAALGYCARGCDSLAETKMARRQDLVYTVQRHEGNTARLARRSDDALEVRVSVGRIAPSLLDLGRAGPSHS
ncbi:hypothetical protein PR048_007988 [Dryococelus australis]|uniref:Uncharacterized protein n=1 Tax=Dryococelus australis TaxID=614101 RepID=A0ABQ9HVT0_9NEOP|nr:hypothetical protein PR048_007988 [Dryococelus australis]